jgi:hypothetical protein
MIDNDLTNSEAVSYLLLVLVLCYCALLTGMNGCQRTRDLGVPDGHEQLSQPTQKLMLLPTVLTDPYRYSVALSVTSTTIGNQSSFSSRFLFNCGML